LAPDRPGAGAPLADADPAQRELGRLDEALAAEERFLALARKAYGDDHSTTAYAYGELAMTGAAKGEVERPRMYFARAIEGFDALGGEDSQASNLYRTGLGKM